MRTLTSDRRRRGIPLLLFPLLCISVLFMISTAAAAPSPQVWPYQGINWNHPNYAWVLQQYDKAAEKPGSAGWIRNANITRG
jgi:hypothetical protein